MNIKQHTKRSILQQVKQGEISAVAAAGLLKSLPANAEATTPSKQTPSKQTPAMDIAIIGVSGRFPQADNVAQYWENLCQGRDCITEIPPERWAMDGFFDPDPQLSDRSHCKWGGFINDIDCFDSLFFNISPKEAQIMDPQQRLFLQEAWRAIENAGYSDKTLDGSDCAVYVAHGDGDYKGILKAQSVAQDANFFTGNAASILAARIAYLLNLRGPAVTVDTACSSSLVALHLACESIRSGESTMAIAGGVSLTTTPNLYILASNAGMLSEQGRCFTFDDKANGFVPGEGVGVVVLKPLAQALADGDNVQAVIKSSGMNQDGATNGITAPNSLSQRDLEMAVYRKANISADTISFVEAHGTGTILGDPIEVKALTDAFRADTDKTQFCALGSVKSNLGHAQLAAGMMSLIKVVLSMQHQMIPPSIHYQKKNRHIEFDNSPFFVNTELMPWQSREGIPRRAALSAFGFSGTNAHILVEEAPIVTTTKAPGEKSFYLVPLSAKSEQTLQQAAIDLVQWLKQNPKDTLDSIDDIAYTLHMGRSQHFVRTAFVVKDSADLLEQLELAIVQGLTLHNLKATTVKLTTELSDKGNQWLSLQHREPQMMNQLKALYLDGYQLQWEKLHDTDAKRIALPVYAFAKHRHWVEVDDTTMAFNAEQVVLHPLVHLNSSTLFEQRYTSVFSGKEYCLADHLVNGNKMLPGVAYLEMACVAATLASQQSVTCIRDVVWANPIVLDDEQVEPVHIALKPDGQFIDYQVYSEADGRLLHSQGKVTQQPLQTPANIDLEAILARCSTEKDQLQHYCAFQDNGVQHGPAMQGVKRLYIGEGEAIARLQLPERLTGDFDQYQLSPVLLDSALQSAIGVAEGLGVASHDDVVYLPFALGELKMFAPLSSDCFSYSRQASGSRQAHDMFYYDIDIINAQGEVLVSIVDFSMRALTKNQQAAKTLCFEPQWVNAPLAAVPQHFFQQTDTKAVVLLDLSASQTVTPPSSVLKVGSGKTFESALWTMDFDNESHYPLLLKTLQNQSVDYDKVVLLAGDDSVFLPLFWLSRALLIDLKHPVQIVIAYAPGGLAECYHSALEGFARSAFLENRQLLIRTVALNTLSLADARQWQPLLNEFSQPNNHDAAVRWLDGERQVKRLAVSLVGGTDNKSFKPQGVYLVTGGLGGIGMALATHLATHYQAKLVLTGRSKQNAVIENQLARLQQLGGEAIYCQADMSDSDATSEVVKQTMAQFGCLNGVMHLAGVNRDGYIADKSRIDIDTVLAAKLAGTLNLDHSTAQLSLDCFVLFGSNTADLGNAGQVDYAYANHFMQSFAQWRSRNTSRSGRSLCIAWPLWQDGGMGVDQQTLALLKQTVGLEPIKTDEGMRLLENLLQTAGPVCTLIRGDESKILARFVQHSQKNSNKSVMTNPSESQALKTLQAEMIQIVSDLMQIPQAEVLLGKEMNEFGFNSLSLTELSNNINLRFGLSILPSIFFEYASLEALTCFLISEYGDVFSDTAMPSDSVTATPLQTPQTYRLAQAVTSATAQSAHQDIAIIGMAGVMPQSADLDAFWKNLDNQQDLVREIPASRWDWQAIWGDPRKEAGKTNVKWGAFIDDVDKFDTLFFGISAREAELMDPQQRLFMQTVWHTLEDAGYKASDLAASRTGVFAGVSTSDYTTLLSKNGVDIDAYTATGMAHSVLANRVSHYFNFTGPSEPIDTACSSALVAMNRAVEAIHSGSCDMAIAGGVNVMLSPEVFIGFSKAGMLSPEGRSKTFDASANGYARGEGVGTVLLKPLAQAERDGDNIYAVIKGIEVNHGGRANSLTAPNPNAQADLIVRAVQSANIKPDTIDYIEAHGTGTPLGDPVEINGLIKAFKRLGHDNPQHKVAVGAVKTNVGHLEAAAGIAGVFKVLLSFKHQRLPGNVHFHQLNPMIKLDNSPLTILDKSRPWPTPTDALGNELPRRAGVSSFGFGGANSHVLLEHYRQKTSNSSDGRYHQQPLMFVLSAKDNERLKEKISQLADYIATQMALTGSGEVETRFEPNLAQPLLLDSLTREIAGLLNVASDELEPHESLYDYGFDEHKMVALSGLLSEQYQTEINLFGVVKEAVCLNALVAHLIEHYADALAVSYPDCCLGIDVSEGVSEGVSEDAGNDAGVALHNIAFTLHQGREAMVSRMAVIATTAAQLLSKLQAYDVGRPAAKAQPECSSEHITQLLAQKALPSLLDIWCNGQPVDWSALYVDLNVRRISLPLYPFAKERYWVPGVEEVSRNSEVNVAVDLPNYVGPNTGDIHPLIGENCADGSGEDPRICYGKHLQFGEFFIQDHNIAGNTILPGVGFLEMAMAAGQHHDGRQPWVIRNLMWAMPIAVKDQQQVYIELKPVVAKGTEHQPSQPSDKYKFDIYSTDDKKRHSHSQGQLDFAPMDVSSRDYLPPQRFDIAALSAQCVASRERKQVYQDFASGGFGYGPSLQVVDIIHSAKDMSIAKLSLPAHLRPDFGRFLLHPSLMDGALQTIMGIGDKSAQEDDDVYIPFSLEKLEFLRPLTETIYVYARYARGGNMANKGIRKFDVTLLDESGEELVRFRHFTSRAIVQAKPQETVTATATGLHYYRQIWQNQPLSGELTAPSAQAITLLFSDKLDGHTLARVYGHKVITVRQALSFGIDDNGDYQLNPNSAEDYQQLLQALQNQQQWPTSMVHLWMVEADLLPLHSMHNAIDALQCGLNIGLYSIIYLLKALTAGADKSQRQRLLMVLPGEKDQPYAPFDMLSGLVNSSAQVNRQLSIHCLHLPSEFIGQPSHQSALCQRLFNECFSVDNRHKTQICYQQNQRYVRALEVFDKNPMASTPNLFKAGGKYLVTGGLGSIGQIYVSYLTTRLQADVIISGRSENNNAVQQQLAQWATGQGSVCYVQADVGNSDDVTRLTQYIQNQWGSLNGILHVAGIVDDVMITDADTATFEATLRPKVHGLVNLDRLSQAFTLDCLVFFSSISSVMGDFGGCSYAAANAFMDSFAEQRNQWVKQGKRSGHSLSIGWPLWADGSMALPPKEAERYFDYSGMLPLQPEQGWQAINELLSTRLAQVTVASGDRDKIMRILGVSQRPVTKPVAVKAPNETLTEQPDHRSVSMSPSTPNQPQGHSPDIVLKKTEAYLKKLMSQATKIPERKIDSQVALEQYGIDSMLIMELNNLLEAQFDELPRTLFFEYSDLHSLAGYFIDNHEPLLLKVLGLSQPTAAATPTPTAIPTPAAIPTAISTPAAAKHPPQADGQMDIAVIGLAGRYPKAKNKQAFWDNLKQGRDCIEEVPSSRWDLNQYFDQEPNKLGKSIGKWGGFIDDIDQFDPQFFGITPVIAMTLDPQERLVLETAWEAIEDAGYTPKSLTQTCYGESGNEIGVFVGIMYDDYKIIEAEQAIKGSLAMSTYWNSTLANRVSYQFNYSGPSVVVDTACSSSIVAVHQACQALRSGECRVAIASGVSISIHPSKYNRLSFVGMLAADGRCRSFGEGGTGYVPGEGVGSVILKPLAAAKADGDDIMAVIKGSVTNHGGKTNGFSVPNPNAQGALIAKALKKSGVHARTISYVETHGTGTALGDPIEIAGLNKAFRPYTKDNQFCAIGSVKSNIGHCEGAAGLAAVTKSVLQLQHKQIVPSLHSDELNSHIDFARSPFVVQQKLSSWQQPVVEIDGHSQVYPRTSGISSFGAGGTNVHVIMQEYEEQRLVDPSGDLQQPVLILLSAKNADRLKVVAQRWIDYIDKTQPLPSLNRVAYTLQTGRQQMNQRLAVVVENWQSLGEKLKAWAADELPVDDLGEANIEDLADNFDDDGEDAQYVTNLIINGRWGKLAKLWLNGTSLDFVAAYGQQKPVKVSGLPTYPFARETYWLPMIEDDVAAPAPVTVRTATPAAVTATPMPVPVVAPVVALTDNDGLYDLALNFLKQALSEVIHVPVEQLKAKKDFFEIGMDSITITQFAKAVNTRFPEVSETALFTYQTVAELARFMVEGQADVIVRELGAVIEPNLPAAAAAPKAEAAPEAVVEIPPMIDKRQLKASLIAFLIKELSLVNADASAFIDAELPLQSTGIDSIRVKRFIKSVCRQLPGLSDTALYAFETLSQAAEFLLHGCEAVLLTGVQKGVIDLIEVSEQDHHQTAAATPPFVSADIAIIGINTRVAGADTPDQLWHNLSQQKVSLDDAPTQRWQFDQYFNADKVLGKAYCQWGGFLADHKNFDPLFFGITPFEAQIIDPQERLFLQSCWHTIEDAGYTRADLSGDNNVGVFVGVTTPSYNLVGFEQQMSGEDAFTGLSFGSIANRVSFHLNLTGPSMPVDTMCSSSLVAIHLACDSIRRGECKMAIAGGVNLYLHPSRLVDLCRTNLLSGDGINRSFAKGGEGFVPAEAVGSILLKPLEQAMIDDDHIYGVIKGSAVGHSGRTGAYFSPNPAAQAAVISRALANAGFSGDEIDYVEAHAVGSQMTDAIELEALRQGYATHSRQTPLRVGSVKPNIGHSESASGMTQLAKLLLQLQHKTYLPTVIQGEVNNTFNFAQGNIELQTTSQHWSDKTSQHQRRAGISSFGAGGSSAHLIVEQAPTRVQNHAQPTMQLVILSAKLSSTVKVQAQALIDFMVSAPQLPLADIAYTLQVGREAFDQRLAVVCQDTDVLLSRLKQFVAGQSTRDVFFNDNQNPVQFDDDSAVATLLQGKHYSVLAQLWVNGMDIDWHSAYHQGQHQRLSLPGYPFARRVCWPEEKAVGESVVKVTAKAQVKAQTKIEVKAPIQTPDTNTVATSAFNHNSLQQKLNGVTKWKNGLRPFLALSFLASCQAKGVFINHQPLSRAQLMAQLAVQPDYIAPLDFALNLLQRSEFIVLEGSAEETVYRASKGASHNIKEEIRALHSQMARLFRAVPEFEQTILYFKHCCDHYSEVFSQSVDIEALLLPQSGVMADCLDSFLLGQHRIGDIVNGFIEQLLQRHFPNPENVAGKIMQVLELGAGTLAKTLASIDFMQQLTGQVVYHTANAKTPLGERKCAVLQAHRPKLSINQIDEQTLDTLDFDVVIIHSSGRLTPLEQTLLGRLDQQLNPQSMVIVAEPLEQELLPLTLGLLDSQWSYLKSDATATTETILAKFESLGFYQDRCFHPWLTVLSKDTNALASVHQLGGDDPGAQSAKNTPDEILLRLQQIIGEQLGLQPSELGYQTNLIDLGVNSVMSAMLLVQIQQSFAGHLTGEAFMACATIADMAEVIIGNDQGNQSRQQQSTTVLDNPVLLDDSVLERHEFTSSRGQTIEYYTVGSGKPLLFLTALAFNKAIWVNQIAHYKATHQLIFPHLPGHEGSSFHGRHFTFEELADDLAELLAAMQLPSIHLLGWCMAGNIAQIFALRHPQMLDSLSLLCTTPTDARTRGMGSSILTEYSNDPLEAYELEFQNIYQKDYFDNPQVSAYLDIIHQGHSSVELQALGCLLNNLFRFDTQARLKDLTMPVLVMSGRWDIAFPPEQVKLLHDNIPGAQYIEFEQGGHLPFLNQAQTFNRRLSAFLDGLEDNQQLA